MLRFKIQIHPGLSLIDMLEAEPMTQDELASKMGVDIIVIKNICDGSGYISNDIATKLYKVFGVSAEFRNNMQKRYDEDKLYFDKD